MKLSTSFSSLFSLLSLLFVLLCVLQCIIETRSTATAIKTNTNCSLDQQQQNNYNQNSYTTTTSSSLASDSDFVLDNDVVDDSDLDDVNFNFDNSTTTIETITTLPPTTTTIKFSNQNNNDDSYYDKDNHLDYAESFLLSSPEKLLLKTKNRKNNYYNFSTGNSIFQYVKSLSLPNNQIKNQDQVYQQQQYIDDGIVDDDYENYDEHLEQQKLYNYSRQNMIINNNNNQNQKNNRKTIKAAVVTKYSIHQHTVPSLSKSNLMINSNHHNKFNYYHDDDFIKNYQHYQELSTSTTPPILPPIIEVTSRNFRPLEIHFRSNSRPIKLVQKLQAQKQQQFEQQPEQEQPQKTITEEEPRKYIHHITKPIMQEVRELIQPYRKVIQEIHPVVEEIHTIITSGRSSSSSRQQQIVSRNKFNNFIRVDGDISDHKLQQTSTNKYVNNNNNNNEELSTSTQFLPIFGQQKSSTLIVGTSKPTLIPILTTPTPAVPSLVQSSIGIVESLADVEHELMMRPQQPHQAKEAVSEMEQLNDEASSSASASIAITNVGVNNDTSANVTQTEHKLTNKPILNNKNNIYKQQQKQYLNTNKQPFSSISVLSKNLVSTLLKPKLGSVVMKNMNMKNNNIEQKHQEIMHQHHQQEDNKHLNLNPFSILYSLSPKTPALINDPNHDDQSLVYQHLRTRKFCRNVNIINNKNNNNNNDDNNNNSNRNRRLQIT